MNMRLSLVMVWAAICAAAFVVRASEPPASAAAELRVMSFNIRYGTADDGPDAWVKRRPILLDVIREAAPDILGMQEALLFQIEEIRAAIPGYEQVGVGRDDGKTKGEYSAILYRRERFEAKESGTFWFSDTPEVVASKSWGNNIPRICTWVRLAERTATGATNGGERAHRTFYVFNLHLDHQSEPSRQRSGELLAKRILTRQYPDEPVIVTGDFNCGEQSAAIQFLTGKSKNAVEGSASIAGWTGLVDTYRAMHPDGPEQGTFHAFKGIEGVGKDKIDFVLASPGLKVLGAEIVKTARDGRYPSDHFAVTAKMRWE